MEFKTSHVLPTVWGEGALFGFSGLDGKTKAQSDFVATYGAEAYGLLFHTRCRRELAVRVPEVVEVLAALSDLYAVDTEQGNLVVTFSAWHTIVGWLPEGSEVVLSYADGKVGREEGRAVITEDEQGGDVIVLICEGDCFAVGYGDNEDEAMRRAEAGLKVDMVHTVSQRLKCYDAMGDEIDDEGEAKLLKKCFSVMKVNTLSADAYHERMWSTPDRVPHRHMWLWDSVFHSLAMNYYDADIARQELQAVLDYAREDGMIPHMIHYEGGRSEITQPPVLAWGVWENYQHTGNTEALVEMLPVLEGYLKWDMAHRDANHNSLLEWYIEGNPLCRSGESGLDNSPRFDEAVELDAVDFSVLAGQDWGCLAKIARELGEQAKADEYQGIADTISGQVHNVLWDDDEKIYLDRHMDGRFSQVKAVTSFFPLLLADCPREHVKALAGHLNDPATFGSVFPVPSVALNDEQWSTDMWRGATWINSNYLIITGLKRHGEMETAKRLADTTIAMVRKYYEQFGVVFEFYDARDEVPPTECDRKGPCVKPYNLYRKMDSIRDYHWTAALTSVLLRERYV